MIRKIIISIMLCISIACLCVCFSCCSDINQIEGKTYISFSSETRSVFPRVNTVSELGTFTLSRITKTASDDSIITETAEELCTWVNYSDFAAAKLEIIPGVYNFVLDSSYCGTKYSCRLDDVEIIEGEINRLDFVLKVNEYSQETKGSVDIALLLPSRGGFSVKGCLLGYDMQVVSDFAEKNITVNEYSSGLSKAFYTAENVPSGTYFIRFRLFKDGCPLNTVFESVTVADSLVSEGFIELTADEIEKVYTVDLIIPTDAVLNEGEYGYCYSRHMGITLPAAGDFSYEGFEFLGWKEVIPDGDNFNIADSLTFEIPAGSIGNREYMAVFCRNDDEQGGQTPQETEIPAEPEENDDEQGGQTPQETEIPAEPEENGDEQGGQTPHEKPSAEEETKQNNSINWEEYYRIGKIGRFSDYALGSDIDYIGLFSYDGRKLITALENSSCQNNVQLEIPEGIEVISTNAFMNSLKISTTVIGPDVKCIEPHAFKGCQNMYEVTMPQNCDWYVCCQECTTESEIKSNGIKVNLVSVWNTALLLKSDYEGKYWYKLSK